MSSRQPAEVATAQPERAPDPYRGTPLGVDAAWCPDGIDVPPAPWSSVSTRSDASSPSPALKHP